MRTLIMSILLLVGVSFTAAANDPQAENKSHGGELITDSCAAGGAGCDILAQAVLRRDFANQLSGKLSERFGGLKLCPEDNPQCCPSRLMPLCTMMVGGIVELLDANLQLERALAGNEMPAISLMKLDLPDDFFPEGSCTPTSTVFGCKPFEPDDLSVGVIVPTCPFPMKWNGYRCELAKPPVPIPPRHCEPWPYCLAFGEQDIPMYNEITLRDIHANIQKPLSDTRLQLKTLRDMRAEINAAFDALEGELRP